MACLQSGLACSLIFCNLQRLQALKLCCIVPVRLSKCSPRTRIRILERIESQGNTVSAAIPGHSFKFLNCVLVFHISTNSNSFVQFSFTIPPYDSHSEQIPLYK
ncbi:hypothetical protein M758_1G169000 [Ceratodon purpureus]|uniref:Secreted protein n=1 Tax=Ceratodon purpureus TaxID=3225 RepID=A0A8T0J773_CERPU|nr:hypothetical protein KC19_1G172400 [Ceratodon purpureus]KAG0630310.1 hypothetical protein M758_1G169000 [Ceratodon purpureus]